MFTSTKRTKVAAGISFVQVSSGRCPSRNDAKKELAMQGQMLPARYLEMLPMALWLVT